MEKEQAMNVKRQGSTFCLSAAIVIQALFATTYTAIGEAFERRVEHLESPIQEALVNNVVSASMSRLLFKTRLENGIELVKGFLDAAIDGGPAAGFQ